MLDTYHSLTRFLYAFRISCRVARLWTPSILYGFPNDSIPLTDDSKWVVTIKITIKNENLMNKSILTTLLSMLFDRLLTALEVLKKLIDNIIYNAVLTCVQYLLNYNTLT